MMSLKRLYNTSGLNAMESTMSRKELAKAMRMLMNAEDELFYYRSIDDDSGVVLKRSRIKPKGTYTESDSLQLTLPLHQENFRTV